MAYEQVKKKIALVTGATGGIGSEVALSLDRLGYQLIIVGRSKKKLELMASRLQHEVTIRVVDFESTTETQSLASQLEGDLPAIDLAFLNAGIVEPGFVADRTFESIEREIQINLTSTIQLARSCLNNMEKSGGHLIFTSSLAALLPVKSSAIYSATKFALRGFICALQQELVGSNMCATGIYPGGIDTNMLLHEAQNGGSKLNFLNKPQTPVDVAKVVEKVLITKKLEVYLPWSDSVFSRVVMLRPGILPRLLPWFEKLGESGRLKYLKSKSS